MNDLTLSAGVGRAPVTMTSREIADLVGARHDSVRRTIERLAEKAVIQLPPMVEIATGARPTLEYVFGGEQGKRDSYIVVAQLCPEFTARLVDRWQELEGARSPAAIDVRSLPQLQSIALQLIEVNREQAEQIDAMTPKAAAYDRIATSDGSLCVTDAAKTLGRRPKVVFQYLRAHRWIYSRAGGAGEVAYQDKLQSGLLEHKVTTVSRTDGSEKSVTQVRVTAKGLARLAQEMPPDEPSSLALAA